MTAVASSGASSGGVPVVVPAPQAEASAHANAIVFHLEPGTALKYDRRLGARWPLIAVCRGVELVALDPTLDLIARLAHITSHSTHVALMLA